jgi:hypothetical protein
VQALTTFRTLKIITYPYIDIQRMQAEVDWNPLSTADKT